MKKKLAFLSVVLIISFPVFGQKKVLYSTDGATIPYEKIFTEVTFAKGTHVSSKEGGQVGTVGALAIAGGVAKVGLTLTTAILTREQKKYATEYSGNKVNVTPRYNYLPSIIITRKFTQLGKTNAQIAYKIILSPQTPTWEGDKPKLSDEELLFYKVSTVDFFYSEAKITKKNPYVDLGVELGLVYISGKGNTEEKAGKLNIKSSTSGIMYAQYLKPKDEGLPKMGNLESSYISGSDLVLLEVKYKIVQSNTNKTPFENILAILEAITEPTSDLLETISESIKEAQKKE